METTTNTAAAMTAARATCDALPVGATTSHSGVGQVQGCGASAAGIAVRERATTPVIGLDALGMDATSKGSAHPRLEGASV